jgi:uncharacterized protein
MSEEELIAFLSDGASYGFPGEPVERIETHCSIVFLVDDRAFKLKRAITFSALDYTTVERREAACRREVELNRRTAPELYFGTRAIRRDDLGRLTFAGAGPVADWLVVMRRFAQDDLFDHLAASGRLDAALAGALAEEIARLHAGAEISESHGGKDGLARAIDRNHHDQSTVAAVLGQAAIDRLHVQSLAALEHQAALLERRRTGGRVRLCHGDLRLANICLYHGRPTLFDAIEFAEDQATIDVLYDLAFLLMDLCNRGLHVQANVAFNRYLDATGDEDGLPALPLMLSARAGTRAFAVAGASLRKSDPDESRRLAAAAQQLLALALSLLDAAAPKLIAIGGGSEFARAQLAAGIAPSLAPLPGGRILAPAAFGKAQAVLAAGYSAIAARPFARASERQGLAGPDAPLVGVWLGGAKTAPAGWHAVNGTLGKDAAIAAVHRLLGGAGRRRGAGDPSPRRRRAGGTLRRMG